MFKTSNFSWRDLKGRANRSNLPEKTGRISTAIPHANLPTKLQ